MRLIIIIITLGLFCSCNSKHLDNNLSNLKLNLKNIDSLSSLSILFDNSTVKGNHILWPIDYQDIYEFSNELSSDSLCHTAVDTILKLDNKYFVIFRTDRYEKGLKADCHVCCPDIGIAEFEKNQEGFRLINFKKHVFKLGEFGEYGSILIDTLCTPIIKVSSGWTGTGAIISYDNYYDINNFSYIYGLTTFSSNGGNYNENEANYEEYRKVIVDKNDSSFVVETATIKIDSINKSHVDKYFERITLYNDNGSLDIKTKRLER